MAACSHRHADHNAQLIPKHHPSDIDSNSNKNVASSGLQTDSTAQHTPPKVCILPLLSVNNCELHLVRSRLAIPIMIHDHHHACDHAMLVSLATEFAFPILILFIIMSRIFILWQAELLTVCDVVLLLFIGALCRRFVACVS